MNAAIGIADNLNALPAESSSAGSAFDWAPITCSFCASAGGFLPAPSARALPRRAARTAGRAAWRRARSRGWPRPAASAPRRAPPCGAAPRR
ncbi:hypothetical protein [Beduinella massiliensis]|uniref:hypothetical protein n=1 Tax=Beduinella massiliensis TaxID=1852363 RepID=UPI003D155B2A